MHIDIYHIFNFGFALVFTILGILMFVVHMPNDSEFKGYRKARLTLGLGFVIMSLYCIFRTLVKQEFHDFQTFWLLIGVSLLFSWLNYTAFLFLIRTSHKVRYHFVVDGIMPLVLILVGGVCGMVFPYTQKVISYLFGLIFLLKCAWMFYVCDKEWQKVAKDLENNYDNNPDIVWMRRLVWLTIILSIFTLIAWYIPALHVIYAIIGPVTHTYMVLKMVNYMPRKICEMRNDKTYTESESIKIKTPVSKSIVSVLEPKIEQWIANKGFCKANLSIKDVALELGTNHNYLSKYLNNNLNVSFQVWLNTLRVVESKQILLSENISIEEVGIKVGIPQSYNFSRWFRIVTGETPFKYRQHLTSRVS